MGMSKTPVTCSLILFIFGVLSLVAFSYALKKNNIPMSKSAQIRTTPGQFGKLFGAHYLRNRVVIGDLNNNRPI